MTFRTIDENATNNINKYGIRNSSFADIANAYNAGGIKGVGNSLSSFITSKDLSNIKEFNRLVSEEGVSSQTAWYKTMQTSSNAAKELFDNEENLVKSGNSVILSEKAISTATNTMTFSAKAGQVALKGLALAGNMVVGILAGFVISKAIEGLDNLVHAADNAKESAESFSNSFSSMNDEFNSNNSKLSDLQKKYDELSKGVNSLGENVSLTTDEYDEYKQVVSEISDMMPSLLARYDDEGNKIGFVQGKLSDLNAEYDKYKKNKAMDLVNGENDNGDSIKDVFNNYQYQTAHIDANGNAVGKRKLIGSSNYEKIGQLQAEINSGYDGVFGQNKLTNADIEKKTALIQKYQSEIDASVSAIQDALSAIAQSGDEYYKLSDQEQQFLDTYINSLSQDFIDENNLTNETNARTFINNLINDIESSKPEIMKAYNDLFSFNIDDTDLSPEEVQKKVNELIQQLAKALGENNWKDLKIRLGFEFVDDNVKNYKNTLKRFKDSDKIKDFFNTEGINTQKEIDAFNDVTKGINDADEAIQEYEQSIQQAQTDTEELGNTLANINKTKSGIGGLFDKYEQNEGYLTQDEVASVLETNPEYIQYLVKVGDQYKLNEQALNDWNEVNKEQKQEINNQMGGNDYLSNYSPLLDSIQDNASHPNGGVGNTNIGSQLDDLINKNKEWNTSLQNGEITTAQYFQNISNAITNSGLEDALHSLNGKFDDSTDYIEETVSVLATQLSDGLAQSTKRFEEGQTSVQDYIEEINAGSDAEKKLLASTYDLNISQETGKASLDGLSGAALEAAQNYNSLVDSQNALASTSGFVDVLSQNAEFLSQYTDEAGNLMDSIFDDSRFNDYISNMSNSIVDFANQNTTTMGDVANWLAETAGISTDQATSIIAQGGEAVQEAVGGSLNGVQSMTSFAMSQVGTAAGNAASAVGSVLSSLGQMISSFSYKITAKPFIQGKSKFDWNPKTGFDVSLPTFGFDIKGSGGKSVKSFSTSLGKAGEALNKYGASQNASAAFNNINSYKPKRKLSANKPSSYRPTYKPKSSGKSGGGSKSPSSGSGSGSEKEPTKKDYDWIETLISRINRQVSNLGKTVSATYKTWSTRNNALAQELGTVNQQISAEQQAYNKYMQLANSVGLPEGYASLVRNGTIDVSTIQDDDLNDKIEKYQNYYNKALEASDAVQDLQDKLAELAKTKFDNVNSEYEAQLKQIDHSINVYDKMIDTAETQGYIASQKYYNALISTESSNISELQLQYSSLTSARNEAIKAGNIAKYSEEWYSMTDSINSVEEAIQDANKSLIEYKNNLRQVNWDFFDKQEDYISKLQDESDWLIDLITTENKLFNSDNGKINPV